jgi:glycogen phosphorylase
MRVKQFLVLPKLPERIKPLQEMAHNLWYSWNWDIVRLFIRLDADMWESSYQNPVEMLSRLPQDTLSKAAHDEAFLVSLDRVYERYQDYLTRKKWFHYKYGAMEKKTIAYFSLEYGLDTGLPVYSGGLGVLSGDTLKSASDVGIPMVAVGLLYRYGYFRQMLSSDGWQQERYEENDWYHMPVQLVKNAKDEPLRVSVDLDGTPVQLQVWKVQVGLTPLYLLDSNIPENSSKAREVTSVLYGGDKDMRVRQEIALGIGGVRALHALGMDPDIYHCNEGHSWFLALERLRLLMQERSMSFAEASAYVWATSIFTTHTPVPAGNERFDPVLLFRYLGDTIKQLGISWKDFLSIGRVNPTDESEPFCMTVAALKYSASANGVSKLHQRVSRDMWHNIWPGLPNQEVPIKGITNGVHIASWISHDVAELYESYFGPRFSERPGAAEVWDKVDKIPDIELWRVHTRRRERLIFFARKRLAQQFARRSSTQLEIQYIEGILDPQALTIGFARRFSTYKRGYLMFYDPDRLARIVNDPKCPVQIIIAGKAHPLDNPGKEIIKRLHAFMSEDRFKSRIVFLEDYDINVARYLVQGTDVWLNNPRRPEEASGTSGMKAALNGALNFSVLDGWWDEGYDEQTGFKIGNGEEYENADIQDKLEAESFYNTLERQVVPLYYNRNGRDFPSEWVQHMKASIKMAGQRFSAQRMIMNYTDMFYVPALKAAEELSADNFAQNREVTSWLDRISRSWDKMAITDIQIPEIGPTVTIGQKIPIRLKLHLDSLSPEDVKVEIVSGRLSSQEQLISLNPTVAQLIGGSRPGEALPEGTYEYTGEVVCRESGRFGITARIVPKNDHLLHTKKPKLICWW